jgi:hypothetical protein
VQEWGAPCRLTSCCVVLCCAVPPPPQVLCYEDNRLLKLYKDIVKLLYNAGEGGWLLWGAGVWTVRMQAWGSR